ncbi:hypothetical protein OAG63_01455 [Methylacidiphilales bacterium]|nr:hypothetical protein [Candidatus Methylacidiphilales bacterium]
MSDYANFPVVFWLAVAVLLLLLMEVFLRWKEPWTKPAFLVYGTVGAWYLGDLIYSGIAEFSGQFGPDILNAALGQVILFLLGYRGFVQVVVPRFIKNLPRRDSPPRIDQRSLAGLLKASSWLWLFFFLLGLSMYANWQVLAILWPPSEPNGKVGLFVRPGVGSGIDFLTSAIGYVYLSLCTMFGVFFVLCTGASRYMALCLMIVSWPYFWFDRTRNTMLALLMPAVLCYMLFGRSTWKIKIIICAALLFLVDLWFVGVMHYRENYGSTSQILDFSASSGTKMEGLDMLSELCWMDFLVEQGAYKPNMGQRYFAEIANAVPRTFWPDKPKIGFDYALARGYGNNNQDSNSEVTATIATGMIGQGVANFGLFFGVLAAAFLMSLWTGILTRLWQQSDLLPRLLLYMLGCGLTFNMGRDITLLVLWPFVFGYLGILIWEKYFMRQPPQLKKANGLRAKSVSALAQRTKREMRAR